MIYSESSRGWVQGVVTDINSTGGVVVTYGGNMKMVPLERQQTHLKPVGPAAAAPLQMPAFGSPALPNLLGGAGVHKFNFSAFGAPSTDVFSVPPPAEQLGTFEFDL